MVTDELEVPPSISSSKEINHPLGPGSCLRKIREAKHLTVNEMAKRIRLNPERLTQLENDDYLLMGAPTFAKGYLRAYANQLGVAKEEILTILRAFDDLGLGAEIQHNKPELIHEKMDQTTPRTTRWIGYLVVVLLLSLLAYLSRGHFNNFNKNTVADKPHQSLETTTSLPAPVNNNPAPSTSENATTFTQTTSVNTQTNTSNASPGDSTNTDTSAAKRIN